MKLTILGYSGAYPTEKSGTTSYLLESEGFTLAIDMGSGDFLALKSQMDPRELDALWITHYHGDHIADVNVLQYYRQLNGADHLLKIYGHDEDSAQFSRLTIPNVSEGIAYNHQNEMQAGPFHIQTMKTKHPVPTYAMRITEQSTGKVLTFTADSGMMPEWPSFAKDSDLFLADTFFLAGNEKNGIHFTTKETAEVANQAKVQHIIATHLSNNIERLQLKSEIEQYTDIPVSLATKYQVYEI